MPLDGGYNPWTFAAALTPKNRKPPKWDWRLDQAELVLQPEFLVPFWEGGGEGYDLIGKSHGTGQSTWQSDWSPVDGSLGVAAATYGTSRRITFPAKSPPTRPFALLLVGTFENADNRIIWEINGNTGFSVQSVETLTGIYCNVGNFGAGHRMLSTNSPTDPFDGAVHSILFRFNTGGSGDAVYIDGVDQTSATTLNSPNYGAATVYDFFNRSGLSSAFVHRGQLQMAAIFKGKLPNSVAQHITSKAGQFSLIRPDINKVTMAFKAPAAAGGLSIPVAMHQYARLRA